MYLCDKILICNDMATISIDDTLYTYLDKRRQNKSLQNYIEELLRIGMKRQEEKELDDKIADYEVSDFIKSLQLKGGTPVSPDENGIDARVEKYI